MSPLRRGSFDDPAAGRPLSRAAVSLVRVGPLSIGRATLEPGWRWSSDVKPIMGTAWCQLHHLHVLLTGRIGVELADGERAEFDAGDVFELPPGHDAWVLGDEAATLLDVSGNAADYGVPSSAPRVVVTLLMTDIVGSTPTAARIGDAAWRQVLEDHNRLVRRELIRFRGREVATTGDGFLAMFDSAAAALQCGVAIRAGLKDQAIEVRIGIHTGEVETVDGDVRGIAVHAAARIMAAAGASEILTSAVTRAITEGGGFVFEDRGRHDLKGLPGSIELFALR